MTYNAVTQEGTRLSLVSHTGRHPDPLVLSSPQPFQAQELPCSCSPLSWGALQMGLVVPISLTISLWSPSLAPLWGGAPSHGFLQSWRNQQLQCIYKASVHPWLPFVGPGGYLHISASIHLD